MEPEEERSYHPQYKPGSPDAQSKYTPKETWSCSVSLYMPEMYAGSLEKEPEKVEVNPTTRQATFSDLQLSAPGRYFLHFTCLSSTTGKTYRYVGEPIDVFPEGYTRREVNVEKKVSVRYAVNYTAVAKGKEDYFAGLLHNHFFTAATNHFTVLDHWKVTEGSILAEFSVGGENEASVDNTIQAIYEQVKTSELTFDGHKIPPTSDVEVNEYPYGDNEQEDANGLHPGIIAAIVVGGVLFIIIVIAVIVVLCKVAGGKTDNSGRISPRGISEKKKIEPDSRVSSACSTGSRGSGSRLIKVKPESNLVAAWPEKHQGQLPESKEQRIKEQEALDLFAARSGAENTATGSGTKAVRRNSSSARGNISDSAPPAKDLYPTPTHVPAPRPNPGTETYRKTTPEPSAPTPAMNAYGNTRVMSPSDCELRVESPVAPNRPNGPMLSTNTRRESEFIPVDCKMPGAE